MSGSPFWWLAGGLGVAFLIATGRAQAVYDVLTKPLPTATLPGTPPKKAPSTLGTLRELLHQEGPKALFAGVLPALVLVINPILQYTFFEQLKIVLERRRRVTPKDAFYLGAIGKLLATTITYPYITVKSRMHVASREGPKESLNGSLTRIILTMVNRRKAIPKDGSHVSLDDVAQRLGRIEQAVDATAVEVERISEAQRFTTKLLVEKGHQAPADSSRKVVTPH